MFDRDVVCDVQSLRKIIAIKRGVLVVAGHPVDASGAESLCPCYIP